MQTNIDFQMNDRNNFILEMEQNIIIVQKVHRFTGSSLQVSTGAGPDHSSHVLTHPTADTNWGLYQDCDTDQT